MRIYENGNYRDLTPEEIAERIAEREAEIREEEELYWENTSYEVAVVNEIRKKYDINAELAILRQKEEKPQEYAMYFAYCEECKAFVKEKKATTTCFL